MKYAISASYDAGTVGFVDFPEGKTWDDVQDWYVKWDNLHVQFKGADAWVEFSLNSGSLDVSNWKRPVTVTVHSTDEEGKVDYGKELAES